MTPHILGVGYSYNEYSVTAQAWKEYGIEFDYADDIKQAAAMLSFKEYICIAICADVIPQEDLDALRKVRPVPIIVVAGIKAHFPTKARLPLRAHMSISFSCTNWLSRMLVFTLTRSFKSMQSLTILLDLKTIVPVGAMSSGRYVSPMFVEPIIDRLHHSHPSGSSKGSSSSMHRVRPSVIFS